METKSLSEIRRLRSQGIKGWYYAGSAWHEACLPFDWEPLGAHNIEPIKPHSATPARCVRCRELIYDS